MKIEFRTAGSGSYTTLADDATGDMISSWVPQMTAQPQIEPLARGAHSKVFGRGNRQWSAAVIVDKVHATPDAALTYRATHPATLPDLMDLKITQGSGVTYLVRAALVGFTGPEPDNKSTLIEYQWIAENYTISAP